MTRCQMHEGLCGQDIAYCGCPYVIELMKQPAPLFPGETESGLDGNGMGRHAQARSGASQGKRPVHAGHFPRLDDAAARQDQRAGLRPALRRFTLRERIGFPYFGSAKAGEYLNGLAFPGGRKQIAKTLRDEFVTKIAKSERAKEGLTV